METPSSTVRIRWLTVAEAAEYLRCGERVLRELLANDQVPHVMFAGKALFLPERLDAWLLEQEVGPQEREKGETLMTEADMERLIRDYPQEFLEEPLQLVSQQETFPSGITDLIFRDAQGDPLVMELKHGVLQREHIAQVIDYLGDVEKRYAGKHVELMVVANVIPPQRRTKLERLGVSFREIPEAKFREVAQRHGIELSDAPAGVPTAARHERIPVRPDCPKDKVASVLTTLIAYGERFVTGLGKNLKQDLENSGYQWLSSRVYAQLSRWCHPNRYSEREQWVQPKAHEISTLLFGRVIPRTSHPSYAG